MLSLKTVFTTLKSACRAEFVRTEDLSEAGYLYYRFRLFHDLFVLVHFNLEKNEVDGLETVDEFDWDNDQGLLGCFLQSESDLIAFCAKAMKLQLGSRSRSLSAE